MPGVHLVAIADLSPDNARAPAWRAIGLADGAVRRRVGPAGAGRRHGWITDDWQAVTRDPHIELIVDAPATRWLRWITSWTPLRMASMWSNVTVEADAFAARCWRRGRRRRVIYSRWPWRPAGHDLRSGRLGAHRRLSRGGGRARPQMAAAFLRIDARDGLGLLRPDPRAGGARRAEPQDVQQLSRRLQARHRARRSPTPPGWPCRAMAWHTRRPAWKDIPFRHRPGPRAACWSKRAWSR